MKFDQVHLVGKVLAGIIIAHTLFTDDILQPDSNICFTSSVEKWEMVFRGLRFVQEIQSSKRISAE